MLEAAIATPTRPRPARPVLNHQRLLSAKQAAREYGLAYGTLRDLVFRGRLPVVRFDVSKFARWFFERRDLDRLIESSKELIA